MDHGAPQDLLNASIYFDLRPIAGREALAAPLRQLVTTRAAALPRFLKQLADNALRQRPPLNWRGGLALPRTEGRAVIDLKLQGTALFVDAARVLALAHRIEATGTRARLVAAGRAMNVPTPESESWAAAFEFLQLQRLQVQAPGRDAAEANRVEPSALNLVDRRMLRETLRVAQQLQQRLALDYRR